MDDDRIDFTALDPWQEPQRVQALSKSIVEAHRAATEPMPLYALLVSLAPRAVLTAALASALIWLLPSLLGQREPAASPSRTATLAHWIERGQVPNGVELLKIAEVSHEQ